MTSLHFAIVPWHRDAGILASSPLPETRRGEGECKKFQHDQQLNGPNGPRSVFVLYHVLRTCD